MNERVLGESHLVVGAEFRLIAESIPHIVWLAAPDGKIEYFNRQGIVYTGHPPESDGGWDLMSRVHPEHTAQAMQGWALAIGTHASFRQDVRLRRSDGRYRWHALRSQPILSPSGSVVAWIGTATDIDDAKRVETDLRDSDRRTAEALTLLETLLSNSPVGFGFVDRELKIIRTNEMLAAINGSAVAALKGQNLSAAVPSLWSQLEPLCRRVLDDGESIIDVMISGPSAADGGQAHHWLSSYYPVSLDVEIIGIGVVLVDITERRKEEEGRRQLASIVEESGAAIFGVDTRGITSTWNAASERLFGYTASEMLGQPVAVLAPADRRSEQAEMKRQLGSGAGPGRLETVRRRKDGSLVDVSITASSATDEAGDIVGVSVIVQDISERRAAERALRTSERRLADAQRTAGIGSFEADLITGQYSWSEQLYRLLGIDPELEATLDLFVDHIHPDDRERALQAWVTATEGGAFDIVFRIIRTDSRQRFVHARAQAIPGEDGRHGKLAGTVRDDTDRLESERKRRSAERRFETSFQQAGIGAVIMGLDGIPLRVNVAVCDILGRSEDLLVGRLWREYDHPDEMPLEDLVPGHDFYSAERRYLRPDGSVVWAAVYITMVRDQEGRPEYYLAQLQDITERKRVAQELAHQALHDTLTDLPNRALLADRLVQALAGTRRRGTALGVIFLGLDNFKEVNDSYGLAMGDLMLRMTADRLSALVRQGDTVGRLGSDEFVVICDAAPIGATRHIADRMLEAVDRPYFVSDHEVIVSASAGIAVADDQATPDSLLRDSDAALHLAKARGRGRVELFDEVLRNRSRGKLASASQLRRALDRGEFIVHYQPIIDLSTGAMVSAEALVRWMHPDLGLVGPDDFIPLAEETSLVVPIGAWVLEEACRQLLGWHETLPSMSVAVNLSVRQIAEPTVIPLIGDVLRRTGISAEHLCLELTESIFMDDAEYFGRTLTKMRDLGVKLAIDDFGTGYSSLSYLKHFPVDAVKIDKVFVDGLGSDPHDSALIAAIVAMADALALVVTAEGVESREQLSILKRLQCQRAQGYHLARPQSAAGIGDLLANSYRWTVG